MMDNEEVGTAPFTQINKEKETQKLGPEDGVKFIEREGGVQQYEADKRRKAQNQEGRPHRKGRH